MANTAEVINFPVPDVALKEPRVADIDDGYTRIANELLEHIASADLTARQLKLMLAYIRKTYGFNKKTDRIADEQIAQLTGLSRQNVNKAKRDLLSMNCLVVEDNKIGVNKAVSEWKFSRCLQVSNLVSKPETKSVSKLETNEVSELETHKRHSLKTTLKTDLTPIVPMGDESEKTVAEEVIQDEPQADPVRKVFTHWQKEHHHLSAKLDDKRRKRIKARLAEGFTADELCRAISGAKGDSWLMGKNPSKKRYDGIDTLLRDAAQVERLRDLSGDEHAMAVAQGQYSATTARNLETLQRWAGGTDSGELF
ncbi:replication protein [Klebsiella oxytoca]|uniref:replication protein n=1 Tax=Klebsiella oxytoca TaxID=571 RepID=UPI001C81B18A|nr:replication protein [Klebsiella oxytoca]MBX4769476.1 replication protein [Klebsiella oxytoca]MDM4408594.1 replication protein [Klebsiella oxytoca]